MARRFVSVAVLASAAIVACADSASTTPTAPTTPTTQRPAQKAAPKPAAIGPVNGRLPDGITPRSYDVTLDIDPQRESFTGKVEIVVQLAAPSDRVWLHAEDLTFASARFRHAGGEGALIEAGKPKPKPPLRELAFGTMVPAGEVKLAFEYSGHVGKGDEGLFRQKFDGKWFVYAQSQARFARRILPCFDEPRWKVPWRVKLVVPEKLVALANGGQTGERAVAGGRREVTFAEVTPLPTYLFSVAVGPFALVDAGTVGQARIPVRVAVAPSAVKRVSIVAAKLPAIVEALERYTDRPLAWPKLDLVAVPAFFGAMENVGLITFDVDILVGNPKSASFARKFVRFAGHELAHQWFGNLVTPAWWDDLWLSEGLASWMADKLSIAHGGFDDPQLALALARREAIAADSAPDAAALHRTISGDADADDRFDAISYEKGAAVLAMFERFVGEPVFQRAIQHYLKTHGGRSATSADFVAAVKTVAPQVTPALARYLDRAGVPVVELAVSCAGSPVVELRARDTAIPVCVRYGTKAGSARACGLAADPPVKVALTECPRWLAGNDGGLGYYRVTRQATDSLARAPLVLAERLASGDDLASAVERGELPIAAALAELKLLVEQRTPEARLAALAIARTIGPVVADADRAAWWRWLAARFADQLGVTETFGPKTTLAREQRDALLGNLPAAHYPAPTIAAARGSIERALAKGHVPSSLALALAAPDGGKALFDRLLAKALAARAAWLQTAFFETLGSFPPEFAPRVVELVATSKVSVERTWPALATLLARTSTRTAAWRAARPHFPKILGRLAKVQHAGLISATGSLCDAAARAEVATTFADADPALLARTLARIDRCIDRRAKLGDVAAAVR